MTPWYVEWLPNAEYEFYSIWLQAADRMAVMAAEVRVNDLLSDDPFGSGRYLSEGLYAIDVPPLVAYYAVYSKVHLVKVTWVRKV